MGKLIDGDDGLPAEEVGVWAKEKHDYLCRYIDISRSTRAKFLGPGKAGATYIDLFCGPGRCKVRDTGEWIDGGVVAAWKKSKEGNAPFSQVFIGDLDAQRRQAAATRLRDLGAPVVEVDGAVVDVRGAEVAAGITQCRAGLLAVGGIERRIELGARLLEPVEGFVEVLVDLGLLRGGQRRQLADGHRGDVGGKEGDVVHGIAPQTAARSDVESCSAWRSNSMTASTG